MNINSEPPISLSVFTYNSLPHTARYQDNAGTCWAKVDGQWRRVAFARPKED